MDLADQIDDYICSFEGLGDLTMDSLAIFIFLWAVLALFSVWLCKLLYHKYLNKGANAAASTGSAGNSRQSSVAPGAAGKPEKRLSEPRDLLATKSKVEDLSKPLTGAGGGGGSAGRGRSTASPMGGAAAGARRRVVRQSSTGPENRKKRYVPPPSNVVGPETVSEVVLIPLISSIEFDFFADLRHMDQPSVSLALQRSSYSQRTAHVLGDSTQRHPAQIRRRGECMISFRSSSSASL